MKLIEQKILIAFFLVSIVYICAVSCDTVEEQPDYSYSIENVWWSDSIDGNGDGFVHFKRLNFNVHVAEDVSQKVSPRIYYKVHDATSYTFYAFADDFQVTGNNRDNNMLVSIGPPNKELRRGIYDFQIEIYEAGSDRLETKTDSTFDSVLMLNRFEEPAADKVYSIDAWWTKEYDRNENGYPRSAQLNFDIDVEDNATKILYVELLYRNSEEESYSIYETFDNLTVSGATRADSVTQIIGLPNEELMFGSYDFRINVYEKGSDVLAAFIDEEAAQLNDVKFETEDDDSYFYSIEKVWWTNETDADGDGYTSKRLLNFDVDVDKDESRKIYAKLYFRHPDSSDYSFYDSTADFQIRGIDTADFTNWNISELDSSEYDFLIAILESEPYDTLRYVEAARSALVDTTLSDQKFETNAQDASAPMRGKSFRRKKW